MSKNKQPAKSFRRKSCVIATELAIALMVAPLAFAQQSTEKVEKLEITGTRIKTVETEGASPVSVINAEDIKFEGVKNVENMLNNLPQVFAEYGASVSNGATGTATVNLRNLGSVRTLVLMNGKRLPPGSPAGGTLGWSADLNQIPASLIRRVDVLTGGASAVYGSDAVAGVVNFIMNDRFEGVEAEVNHSFYNHQQNNEKGVGDIVAAREALSPTFFKRPGDKSADGKSTSVSLTMGSNFANGKGNAVLFFGYKKDDPLLQSERDFSACALSAAGSTYACGGSSTSFPGRFITNAGDSFTVANAQGGVRPFTSADIYNFGPLNYFQRPSERYSFNAFGHYDVLPNARVYTEFSFHDDHTVAQIAPSGLFGLVYNASFDNPLLSQAWRDTLGLTGPGTTHDGMLILRRNVEGGGRQDDIRHTSYRGVIGVKGEIGSAWNYDVYGTLGRVVYQETYKNDFSISRATRAMDVITDPSTGAPACRSFVDGSDPNCVPYNIWSLGGVTPQALAYLQTPGFKKGFTSQSLLGGTLAADLGVYGIKLPAANNGIGVAFGVEGRTDELDLSVDSAFESGDLFGQGGPTLGVAGSTKVKDFYTEARVPIMEGQPMADLLSVNGSYRYSDYNSGRTTDSYGLGIEWAPVKMARFRGSYQQAVRAANVIELFTPQGLGLYNNDSDPCAGTAPTRSLQDCMRTGVTAAQYGRIVDSAAGQYNALFGGNPNLKPETSKSKTLGVVLEPTRDFVASIDYFNIKVEDVVGNAPPQIILNQCLDTGDATFCGLIQRDQLGTLWATPQAQIVATNANLSKLKTSGFDVTASYNMRLHNLGKLNFTLVGTYLKEFITEPIPGLGEYDCAGLFGATCGTPLPEWRHKVRATWSTPWNVDLALSWRYFKEVKNDASSNNPLLSGPVPAIDEKMKAMNYFDVAATWNATKNIILTGGINNLFDKDPPIVNQTLAGAPFGNGNTYPVVYDALGRKVFVTLTAKF